MHRKAQAKDRADIVIELLFNKLKACLISSLDDLLCIVYALERQ